MGENNKFPYVNVYKYVVTLDNKNITGELTSEEEMYKKAEHKIFVN